MLAAVARRVDVTLDPAQYPGPEGKIVWDKGAHSGEKHVLDHIIRVILNWKDYTHYGATAQVLDWCIMEPEQYPGAEGKIVWGKGAHSGEE